jgi:hypothetical protein
MNRSPHPGGRPQRTPNPWWFEVVEPNEST